MLRLRRHETMNAAANNPQPWPTTPVDRQEAIRRRAEEIYIRNGRIPGRDNENWAQAEQESCWNSLVKRLARRLS